MRTLSVVCVLALTLGWAGGANAQSTDPVLVGAGDIGGCDSSQLQNSQATANLIDSIPGTVFAVGDLTYPDSTDGYFAKCWAPTWGRHRARMIPAPGNHEYNTPGAPGYYNYFGPVAGDPLKGYYSFDMGAWHVVVLSAECSKIGGCTATSPEGQWLQADLVANPTLCTLALWHEPLYTSISGGTEPTVQPFWQILYDAGAELVINGHMHNYERFEPQDPNGNLDLNNGIREIIAGTGGKSLDCGFTNPPAANSDVRICSTYGVLKLTLHASSYDWQFIPQAGQAASDSGTTSCH
jgi:hypothetical protein